MSTRGSRNTLAARAKRSPKLGFCVVPPVAVIALAHSRMEALAPLKSTRMPRSWPISKACWTAIGSLLPPTRDACIMIGNFREQGPQDADHQPSRTHFGERERRQAWPSPFHCRPAHERHDHRRAVPRFVGKTDRREPRPISMRAPRPSCSTAFSRWGVGPISPVSPPILERSAGTLADDIVAAWYSGNYDARARASPRSVSPTRFCGTRSISPSRPAFAVA